MNLTDPLAEFRIESIFHPSDFSAASEVAFAHALKIALLTKARLSMLHVATEGSADWSDFPGVRDTLERWRLIPPGSPKSAVGNLGLEVSKVIAAAKDPVRASLGFLAEHPADLVVLAVHQHQGRMRWFEKSVGEPIARGAGQMTLFIPHGMAGFVSQTDGSVSLGSILIPITTKPRPQPAVEAATRIVRSLRLSDGTVTLLHVGPSGEMPSVKLPEGTGWTWNRVAREGDPVNTILAAAAELAADLIVMTTDGPDGFLDGLRGTTSERVLRQARCPVANLPVGSMLG
ncbi:MAG TPA: universal stress protein [Verrucomicrobiota bacterium]|nr:universal stress protein [Verrucomicrobiota bacterium]HRZ57927.1 universal stress protein [Candidatus Paceibacterota bacterium]